MLPTSGFFSPLVGSDRPARDEGFPAQESAPSRRSGFFSQEHQ